MRRSPRRIVAAAVSFLLAGTGALVLAPPASAASGDLLFSEYIEGSSNNKALEIYNPTTAPVDLAAAKYSVQLYFNGSVTAGLTVSLSGTLAPDDVFVLAHASANAAILAAADQTSDVRPLQRRRRDRPRRRHGAIVDVIGQIGFDPGTEWGTGLDFDGGQHAASRRRHLRRRC